MAHRSEYVRPEFFRFLNRLTPVPAEKQRLPPGGERTADFLSLTPAQRALSAAAGALLMGGVLSLFFRSPVVLCVFSAFGACIGPGIFRRKLRARRKSELQKQMREALYQLVVSLRAGRSLEGAWEACLEDMDPSSLPAVYPLWKEVLQEMKLGFPIEFLLERMAQRLDLEEMESLSRTVEICKRTEGNIAKVMEQTIRQLQDRMEIQQELRVLLARKKLEQKLMSVLPLLIILLLMVMSPGYLTPLYQSAQGQMVMVGAGLLCGISFWLSARLSRIEL